MPAASRQKELGAYYTAEPVVEFLVAWGLRHAPGAVMDPSCGDGRFLVAAARAGADALVGYDVDASAAQAALGTLRATGVNHRVTVTDFFAAEPGTAGRVDLIVGNPPFIRYQLFRGESRRLALASAARLGVRLTALTSSWAPFVLHALHFLRPRGALAMVVPAEIARTQYGLPTLRAFGERFARVQLLTFEDNLFADAQADTCLLLAEGFGDRPQGVEFHALRGMVDLARWEYAGDGTGVAMDPADGGGVVSLQEALLTPPERQAWRRAIQDPGITCVGSVATVTNGYVSGDNAFFHRSQAEAAGERLPAAWLLPSARSSRSLRGLLYTPDDVRAMEAKGTAHHLVVPDGGLLSGDPDALRRFCAEGEARGVPARYKCRTRRPWWVVPGLTVPDVFVSYMAGSRPRAAVNRAGAVYTNALHGLKLQPQSQAPALALALHTTLARLSMEIGGRSYGGGILKLEPTELEGVAIPRLRDDGATEALAVEVDRLLQAGREAQAVALVDAELLAGGVGWPADLLALLSSARERLCTRRLRRSRKLSQ